MTLPLDNLAWHRSFGQLVETLDTPGFWLGLVRLLSDHLTFNTWVALRFARHEPPLIFAESDEEDGSDEQLFQDYLRGLYLLDPFYIAACETPRTGLFRLDDVAPERFSHTEYYQRYFQRNVVADEIHFNYVLDSERTLCLSLGATQRFSPRDISLLTLVQPWVLALIRQRLHFEQAHVSLHPHPWHPGPQTSFSLPDAKVLTARELEVSQLMLGGCSGKEIARRLAISLETVRAHKKHIYAKLGINSQSELFSIFLKARP